MKNLLLLLLLTISTVCLSQTNETEPNNSATDSGVLIIPPYGIYTGDGSSGGSDDIWKIEAGSSGIVNFSIYINASGGDITIYSNPNEYGYGTYFAGNGWGMNDETWNAELTLDENLFYLIYVSIENNASEYNFEMDQYPHVDIEGRLNVSIMTADSEEETILVYNPNGYLNTREANTLNVDDADADTQNEFQHFKVSATGDTLRLSNANYVIIPGISNANPVPTDGDGNTYGCLVIGEQTWLTTDLQTTSYNDGTSIPNITNTTTWSNLTSPAYSWYDNNPGTAILYNYFTVADTNSLNVCPVDWRVPKKSDYTQLANYLGSSTVAGGKMKQAGTSFWKPPNVGATNLSGFTALPHGYRYFNGVFNWWTYYNYSWTQTAANSNDGNYAVLGYNFEYLSLSDFSKKVGLTVRCIKD